MNFFKHFKTITKHKIKVGQLCFRLGLYKQGIFHDMSKYAPCEFMTGVKYYQGVKSPNSVERSEKGYSMAWLHHKGRNRHHWEYWVDFTAKGCVPAKMPTRYVLEMLCDRIAASMVYQGKNYSDRFPLAYYHRGKHAYIMHPQTRLFLEELLQYLNDNGLDQTFEYIKKNNYLKKDY